VPRTVRDAAFETMRRYGLTTIFGNPGSTEIPFLTDLPSDLDFVLGLHEGSVVGMASGYALARGEPSFVNLHTTAGLGNAVNAIAGARDNRAPLVVVVGQQDRRQVALAPFLTGRSLEHLAGDYPVWSTLPIRAQDVPGAIARAWQEARLGRGPALVVVPMDDWDEPADDSGLVAGAPVRLGAAELPDERELAALTALLEGATAPALVVGAGADSAAGWAALVAVAERLRCPVWQEPFGSRAGFPQDHPLFAGHLPWQRDAFRDALGRSDVIVAVGTNAFKLYLYAPGDVVPAGARVAVVSDDHDEVLRSPCELALLASPAAVFRALAVRLAPRTSDPPPPFSRPPAPAPPATGARLRAGHVLAALAERLPSDAVLVEETPSSRPELLDRIPARSSLGFVSTANGSLGFGLSSAIGLRMGLSERPVVAVLGDGSATYAIQALWSASHYRVGVVLIVLANNGYAVMNGLARDRGGNGVWPAFDGLDVAATARGLGCEALVVRTYDDLLATLDAVVPGAAGRKAPLLVQVEIDGTVP
jgi:benzoylformate decarboxylase